MAKQKLHSSGETFGGGLQQGAERRGVVRHLLRAWTSSPVSDRGEMAQFASCADFVEGCI